MIVKRTCSVLLLATGLWSLLRCCSCSEIPKGGNELTELNPSFYLTTDFILHLNELIKHLAMYSLDDSIDTRGAMTHAGNMWNHTEHVLEELAFRSVFVDSNRRSKNLTESSLEEALQFIRIEKSDFFKRVGILDQTAMEKSVTIRHAMRSSVHRLTEVSVRLLRTLEEIASDARTGRANPTEASVTLFLDVFDRAIMDTQRNYHTQINRALGRVRTRLSSLDVTPELGQYLMSLTNLYTVFKNDVTVKLAMTNDSVAMSYDHYRTMIDGQLSAGISDLLATAGLSTVHTYLHRCLKRYVYPYNDESLAVAKLLYCGEPEVATLEYLVTVAIPILERAAISDSSAMKMGIICNSTECMTNYYTSLADQILQTDLRLQSYAAFIHQELAELIQRVEICNSSTLIDIDSYILTIKSKFEICLATGRPN